jgi:hypothetical protein
MFQQFYFGLICPSDFCPSSFRGPDGSLSNDGETGAPRISRTFALRLCPLIGLVRKGRSASGVKNSLRSALIVKITLISGLSSSRRAHKSVPFSRGIRTSVINKSIDPAYWRDSSNPSCPSAADRTKYPSFCIKTVTSLRTCKSSSVTRMTDWRGCGRSGTSTRSPVPSPFGLPEFFGAIPAPLLAVTSSRGRTPTCTLALPK